MIKHDSPAIVVYKFAFTTIVGWTIETHNSFRLVASSGLTSTTDAELHVAGTAGRGLRVFWWDLVGDVLWRC